MRATADEKQPTPQQHDDDGSAELQAVSNDGRNSGGDTDSSPAVQSPKPIVKRMRWPFPWIWVVPLGALIAAGIYFRQFVTDRGPTITLRIADASGLKPGDTNVSHLGVTVGQVQKVELSSDQSQALVRIRLSKAGEPYGQQGARYWVVRPELSASGVSGLGTITSGPYIEALPGYGPQTGEFTALPRAPQDQDDGITLIMHAPKLEHLQPGSAVSYRGIQVGAVETVDLSQDSTGIDVKVFIHQRYVRLVHRNSKFWLSAGVDVKGSIFSGLQLKVESLRALLSGGITFATPAEKAGPLAGDGDNFPLYSEPRKEWTEWSPRIDLPDGSGDGAGGAAGLPQASPAAQSATK